MTSALQPTTMFTEGPLAYCEQYLNPQRQHQQEAPAHNHVTAADEEEVRHEEVRHEEEQRGEDEENDEVRAFPTQDASGSEDDP